MELMDHSPYNSDLAPNDFLLIPSVKEKLLLINDFLRPKKQMKHSKIMFFRYFTVQHKLIAVSIINYCINH